MPLQAKANGLQLCPIPHQLSGLNMLELRLMCLRVPFMKMVALPSGKQRCIHGPAVNVPSKVDTICTVLPRLPSETELIPLKLKRKLAYRGHYMYDYESVLPTQQPNDEPNIDNGGTSSTQSVECHPHSLSSDDDVFTIAFNVLEQVAKENGFAIHNVPFDGDCLFSSIAYQLEPITAFSVDKNTLRQMVVDHLENNSNLYKRFVSQPV